jgi:hypothetical protein
VLIIPDQFSVMTVPSADELVVDIGRKLLSARNRNLQKALKIFPNIQRRFKIKFLTQQIIYVRKTKDLLENKIVESLGFFSILDVKMFPNNSKYRHFQFSGKYA